MDNISQSSVEVSFRQTMLVREMDEVAKIANGNRVPYENNPDKLEKERKRKKRTEIQSSNLANAEIYDQFYRDHKLLLWLFLILGVMPVIKSIPGRITFKWKSPQMIYAFILYIFTTTLVLRVGYERVQVFHSIQQFDEYIYAVIFIIFLLPHFLIPFVGWSVASRVAQYKSMWGPFQIRYYRVTGKKLTFPQLNFLIIRLFIGCVLLSILFLLSLSHLLEGFLLWHTTAYFHIITMINMNAALFFINSKAIKDASYDLAKQFRKDVKSDCTAPLISQYRHLWLNLNEILQALGNAYARTYSTYCLFMSINITVGSFGALSEILDQGISLKVVGLIVLTIYCATLLFIVCDCAESATSVVAKGVQNILLRVDLLRKDIQTQREIDFFISTIELNPPVVNMQGYGLINRKMITQTISTITIYLIVLLQFKLSMKS